MGDVVQDLIKRHIGNDPKKHALLRAEYFYGAVGRSVYDQRKVQDLTREELAEAIGTTPEIIEKIEDSDTETIPVGILFLVLDRLGYQLKVEVALRKGSTTPA